MAKRGAKEVDKLQAFHYRNKLSKLVYNLTAEELSEIRTALKPNVRQFSTPEIKQRIMESFQDKIKALVEAMQFRKRIISNT